MYRVTLFQSESVKSLLRLYNTATFIIILITGEKVYLYGMHPVTMQKCVLLLSIINMCHYLQENFTLPF